MLDEGGVDLAKTGVHMVWDVGDAGMIDGECFAESLVGVCRGEMCWSRRFGCWNDDGAEEDEAGSWRRLVVEPEREGAAW